MADQAAAEDQPAGGDEPPATGTSRDTESAPNMLAIEQLIRQHHMDVYRYAYRLCGAHTDAEDLVQQTFMVAHQKLHQLREDDRARAWLFSVLRSCFLKSKRRATPATATTLNMDMESLSDDWEPDTFEVDAEQLQVALNQLPDESRMILTMFYFEEASYKDIADELQIKLGTVMSRLSRAKERLRRLLVEMDGTSSARQPSLGSVGDHGPS